jgi:glycosyltransferase involved in cell wall biosynthesis
LKSTSSGVYNQSTIVEDQFESDDINYLGKEDVTIVVPTLNEEKAIEPVLKSLLREGFSNILVVDGNSKDQTVTIVKKHDVAIITQEGKGKTGAIKTAINHIKTPYFVVIDGDCTYDSKDIDILLDKATSYKQVIGARQDKGNIKKINRFGNNIINIIFNLMLNADLTDVCSGLYIMKTDFAKTMILNTKGFDVEVEIAAHSAQANSVKEVPISYGKRVGFQKLNSLRDGYKIVLTILNLGKKYNPLVFYSFAIAFLLTLLGSITIIGTRFFTIPSMAQVELGLYGALAIIVGIQFLILGLVTGQIKKIYKSNKETKNLSNNYFSKNILNK